MRPARWSRLSGTWCCVPYLRWSVTRRRWHLQRCDGHLRAVWRLQLAQVRVWREMRAAAARQG